MGQAKQRRQQRAEFLTRYPTCIYCGGGTLATTVDHTSSRQFFVRREWPEGYWFPACTACNDATRQDEQVMAMIARIYPEGETGAERDEVIEIIRAVANNRRAVLEEMMPSARVVRQELRRLGIVKPADVLTTDIPLWRVDGPLLRECIEAFARKLFTAIHFKETGKIVPPAGGITWRWWTNTRASEIPGQLHEILGGAPTIIRSNKSLKNQFDYKGRVIRDGDYAVYFAAFRLSFAILGVVAMNENDLPPNALPEFLLKPLPPANQV